MKTWNQGLEPINENLEKKFIAFIDIVSVIGNRLVDINI
jgi:hypothetical protein